MNDAELENAVADYLDQASADLSMSPESFAARFGAGANEVTAAVRSALEVSGLLDEAGDGRPSAIGAYRIVREIGRGGMGIVYEAERDGVRYALKMLRRGIAGIRSHERFRREADALARLNHPGIVRIVDRGVDREGAFIVMELIDGRSAADLTGILSCVDAARLAASVARAAAAAHAVGLVHRDIKPANIIVKNDMVPVLLDFGLTFDDDDASLTATGDRLGTPRYMAPEQIEGRATDARTDVYGLGITLFEWATGRPPFFGESKGAIERALADGRIPRPGRVNAAIPRSLARVIRKATAFRKEDRYAQATALAEDLDRFCDGRAVSAVPPATFGTPYARRTILRLSGAAVVVAAILIAIAAIRENRTDRAREVKPQNVGVDREIADLCTSFFDGDSANAARAVDRVLAIQPANSLAQAFGGSIDPRRFASSMEPEARSLLAALESYRMADWAGLEGRIASHRQQYGGSVLLTFFAGAADAARGKTTPSRDAFVVVANAWPKCGTVAVMLARAHAKAGELEEARREFARAFDLGRSGGSLRLEAAKVHYRLREFDAGVDAAQRAAQEDPSLELSAGIVVAQCRNGAERPLEAKAALEGVLAKDPSNVEAHHFLGFICDQRHEIRDAARHYRAAAEADPDHVSSRLFLANLHAGADCGVCANCDAAFAENPDLRAPDTAREILLEVVRMKRLPNDEACRLFVTVALKLSDRSSLIAAIRKRIAEDADGGAARRWRIPLESLVSREPK